ncbi:acetyltransferase (GNAT) family protein [Mucilaginibacter oryzae]|uniref:Acetyltransferase (GNAT) family protein n=1 Tax=Mucilaginibacter oryzae TaxID=468058 RepID=A0A316H0N4_9SPHI|nr:GNAT family N-acetyltransferase [Mucilaginibacter oryzae]PWK68300.1 acetyltransferase (GNAT) family protein [Mucilaginibacter oryzae]
MIKAIKNDKELVINILSRSFATNQSVNYIVRQDHKKKKRIAALMDYSFELCSSFGDVWLSEDKQACALVLYPHRQRTTFASILLDIRLIWQAIGLQNIRKAINREAQIKAKQTQDPMAYLWFIGVHPDFQRQGKGSKLMLELIASARTDGTVFFLETSTRENLAWYERFNFKVYDRLDLGYPLYFLKQ